MEGRRWDDARDLLEDLDERWPRQANVLVSLADTYFELGDLVGYMSACERLVAAGSKSPEVLQGLGGAYLENHFPVLALRTFRQLLRRAPDHSRAVEWRATVEDLERVMPEILEQMGLRGAEALALAELHDESRVAPALGRDARRPLDRLLQRKPDFAPALNNLTQVLLREGRLGEAIATVERVLSLAPENIHALSNLVRSLCLAGRWDEARAAADRLVASTARASDPWVKKAEALAFLGDDARILRVHDEAVRAGQGRDPTLLHLTAVAALRLGREADARKYWRCALEARPGFELAADNLADLDWPVAERDAPWPFDPAAWLPRSAFDDLTRKIRSTKKRRGSVSKRLIHDFLGRHPEIAALVPHLLDRGDPETRRLALMFVEYGHRPELAIAARDYALGQRGPDDCRLTAARVAVEAGLLPENRARMWIKGRWQDVNFSGFVVTDEPVHRFQHGARVDRLLKHAIEMMTRGDPQGAARLLEGAPRDRAGQARPPQQPRCGLLRHGSPHRGGRAHRAELRCQS